MFPLLAFPLILNLRHPTRGGCPELCTVETLPNVQSRPPPPLCIISYPDPRRAAAFPVGWVQSAYSALSSLGKGVTYYNCTFLIPIVGMCPVTDLLWATPQIDLHLHYHLPDPGVVEPQVHSIRAPGKAREAGKAFFCHPKQGSVSIPPTF